MHQKLRRIALRHQGLAAQSHFGKGRQATERVIAHLGYVQIDTLSVVARAHHHTLWTRIPDYQPAYLDQLVSDGRVFEYWFHAASYLPMRDYRFVLPKMAAIKRGESRYYANTDPKIVRQVLDRIRIDGPLKARDFESQRTRNGKWWNWKPTKHALEKLFMQGDLMITKRAGMEKVYDLTERVLPSNTNTSKPSVLEFSEYLLNVSLRANGFTTLKQLTHLRPGTALRKALTTVLQQKIADGSVTEHAFDDLPTLYAARDVFERKIAPPAVQVRLLSPFDNAIIHRDRVQQLFEFDYRLECYLPKEKRQFGYFCLPILYRDQLVGQVDCKAHRKTGIFELIHLHLNDPINDLDHFIFHFTKTIYRFAAFNACQSIRVSNISPKKLAAAFKRALNAVEQLRQY